MPSADNHRLYLHVRNVEAIGIDYMTFEELVYLEDGEHDWFVIGDDDDADSGTGVEEEGRLLSPIPSMPHRFPRFTVSACLGSTIYVLGGSDVLKGMVGMRFALSPDLWYLDTDNNDDDAVRGSRWTRGPPMIAHRAKASAVAVEQKIYVFGGYRLEYDPWAEVFDMQSEKWSTFSVPENIGEDTSSCVILDLDVVVDGCKTKNKSILLYLPWAGLLHSYDLALGKWDMFDADFGLFYEQLVLSGTTLFSMKDRFLYGYDVVGKKQFQQPVMGLEGNQVLPCLDKSGSCSQIHLVSVGSGRLCLLWADHLIFPGPLRVRCTKFWVNEVGSDLVAEVEPTKVFNLANAADFIECLALVPREERKRRQENSYMKEEEEEKKKQQQHMN